MGNVSYSMSTDKDCQRKPEEYDRKYENTPVKKLNDDVARMNEALRKEGAEYSIIETSRPKESQEWES